MAKAPYKKKYGYGSKVCTRCGKKGPGIISKYGIKLCRQCFRQLASELGFKKYD